MGKTGSCSGGQDLAQESFVILLSADGWGCAPSLLFGLRAPSCGVYNQVTVTSKRLHPKGNLPRPCFQCPHPCGVLLPIRASTGGPPTLAGSLGSVSCGVIAPFL